MINSSFGIDLLDFFGNLSYFDTESNTNYLFTIHRQGIIKYNMNTQKIEEQYPQFINNEYMIRNECCLDANAKIIYLSIFSERKLITFNLKSKIWNMNFLDYSRKKPRALFGSRLSFIPNPINEVRLQLFHYNNFFSIFKVNQHKRLQKRLQILKRKIPRKLGYNPLSIDHHLYILRESLQENSKETLDIITSHLFKKRSHQELVACHLAWNQIFFFIFAGGFGFVQQYIVDCVYIKEPTNIHFDVKRISSIENDAICFDQENMLHIVKTVYIYSEEKRHQKIIPKELIAKSLIKKNKTEEYMLVIQFCLYFSRKFKLYLPTVIIGEISRWFSIFQSFK